MITINQINRFVLSEYSRDYRALDILPLDVANLLDVSGVDSDSCVLSLDNCRHWQVETRVGLFCLRRWGAGMPGTSQLQFIQATLWQAEIEGIEFIPLPRETLEHRGFVTFDGSYWELLPWVSGVEEPPPIRTIGFDDEVSSEISISSEEYEYMAIQPFRIVSAMTSLAQFHLAVSTFPIPDSPIGHSTRVNNMLKRWQSWVDGGFNNLYKTIREKWSASASDLMINFTETGLRFLNNAVTSSGEILSGLWRSSRFMVQIQPIIGNCCLRHLRFDYNGVCGMIDFKMIGIDSIVIDVASLLGSMTNPDTEGWKLGLRAYQRIRQLDDYEIFMLKSIYHSIILIEGLEYLSDFFLLEKIMNEYQIDKITNRLEYWNLRMETENYNRNSA
ncbi:MAG: aminoglycoside phosphotransferase family protein [Planctomycetaceae bacterium]|jgi:hypothetical protein|nr:aminoglycoside phosphotransferase family protein [Planctomycetaceae bacterium]